MCLPQGRRTPSTGGKKKKGSTTATSSGRGKQRGRPPKGGRGRKATNKTRRRGSVEQTTSESDSAGDPYAEGSQDESDPAWDRGTRSSEYLQSLGDEAQSAMALAHGDKLDLNTTTLLGGAHDLGTSESMLPKCLSMEEEPGDLDADYSRRLLLTEDLGQRFMLEGVDTLTYEVPNLRNIDMPPDCVALNVGRGPGVLQCLLQLTPGQMKGKDVKKRKEEELAALRDRLLQHIATCRPAMPLQPNSRPELMCRAHQTVPAAALRQALQKERVKYVYLYMWGMKSDVNDYQHLDKASVRAHEEIANDDGSVFYLPNLHDIARTVKTGKSGVPFVWSYTTGRGFPGRGTRGQHGCASMRTFGQIPGVWSTACGSVQTRGPTVTQWNDITKYTMYTLPDHVLRSGGRFTFLLGKRVRTGRERIEWIRQYWDRSVEEKVATLKMIGQGLRMEARVQGKVTAADAAATCVEQRVHDAPTAWRDLGQYQTALDEDPVTGGSDPHAVFFPVRFMKPEAMAAHGIRVADAANKVVRGKGSKEMTASMTQVLIDVYGAAGRTIKNKRCTDPRTLARENRTFWVFDAEAKRRERLGLGKPRRTNPPRRARPSKGTLAEDGLHRSPVPPSKRARPIEEDSEAHLSSSSSSDEDDDEDDQVCPGGARSGRSNWDGTVIGEALARRRWKRRRTDSLMGQESPGGSVQPHVESTRNSEILTDDMSVDDEGVGGSGERDAETRRGRVGPDPTDGQSLDNDDGRDFPRGSDDGTDAGAGLSEPCYDNAYRGIIPGGGAGGHGDGSGSDIGEIHGSSTDVVPDIASITGEGGIGDAAHSGSMEMKSTRGPGDGGEDAEGGGAKVGTEVTRSTVVGGRGGDPMRYPTRINRSTASNDDAHVPRGRHGSRVRRSGLRLSAAVRETTDSTALSQELSSPRQVRKTQERTVGRGLNRSCKTTSGAASDTRRNRDDDGRPRHRARRAQRFGLLSADESTSSSRFSRVPLFSGEITGAESSTEAKAAESASEKTQSQRVRADALQRMRRTVVVRKKNEFGRRGLTWATTPTSVDSRCGSGHLCCEKGEVYEAIWEKYGAAWADHVVTERTQRHGSQ